MQQVREIQYAGLEATYWTFTFHIARRNLRAMAALMSLAGHSSPRFHLSNQIGALSGRRLTRGSTSRYQEGSKGSKGAQKRVLARARARAARPSARPPLSARLSRSL
jgi:hypothetical protein